MHVARAAETNRTFNIWILAHACITLFINNMNKSRKSEDIFTQLELYMVRTNLIKTFYF